MPRTSITGPQSSGRWRCLPRPFSLPTSVSPLAVPGLVHFQSPSPLSNLERCRQVGRHCSVGPRKHQLFRFRTRRTTISSRTLRSTREPQRRGIPGSVTWWTPILGPLGIPPIAPGFPNAVRSTDFAETRGAAAARHSREVGSGAVRPTGCASPQHDPPPVTGGHRFQVWTSSGGVGWDSRSPGVGRRSPWVGSTHTRGKASGSNAAPRSPTLEGHWVHPLDH